jgi:hypothetical protein
MSEIRAALARCAEWSEPRSVGEHGFRLACRLAPATSDDEISKGWPNGALPSSVRKLWTVCREAELFVDVDYGQWGLKLLSPDASAARSASERTGRPADFDASDVVLGEFLGDLELLVIARDGVVLVALPLDGRDDWYRPASSLGEFLSRYVDSGGQKYWEQGS